MKSLIVILIAFFVTGSLSAQTENNSERLITQLKNGTAPGLQFATHVGAKKIEKPVEQKESLVTQIRKGTAPGMKFLPVTTEAAAMRAMPNAAPAQTGKLASEKEMKKEEVKTIAPPLVIPTQAIKQENKQ